MTTLSRPHDSDVEHHFISAVLRDTSLLEHLPGGWPRSSIFIDPKNRAVWDAITEVASTSGNWTSADLLPLLSGNVVFDSTGVRAYIVDLEYLVSEIKRPEAHLEKLRSLAWRRDLMERCERVMTGCQDISNEDQEIAIEVEALVSSGDERQGLTVESVGSFVESYVNDICSGEIARSQDGLSMPLPDLHKRLGFLEPGQLVVIGGPPSMGKTSLLIGLVRENIRRGKRLLYISLDESRRAVVRRLLAGATGVSSRKLRQADISDDEKTELCNIAARYSVNDQLFLVDAAGVSVSDIAVMARRVKRRYGLDGILVDYLQQIRGSNRESRTREVGEIVRGLKAVAKDLGVTCVALSQLSRTYETLSDDELPRATMLRDSGEIEQEANIIMFPWIPLEQKKRKHGELSDTYKRALEATVGRTIAAFISIAKNKEDETFVHPCCWHPEKMEFFEEAKQSAKVEANQFG